MDPAELGAKGAVEAPVGVRRERWPRTHHQLFPGAGAAVPGFVRPCCVHAAIMSQFEQENDLGRGGGEVDDETMEQAWETSRERLGLREEDETEEES